MSFAAPASRPRPSLVLDEPDWFADWFDEAFPADFFPASPQAIADAFRCDRRRIADAIEEGRLWAFRLSVGSIRVMRPALRAWILSYSMDNVDDVDPAWIEAARARYSRKSS
jgi:hypothetical protein